MKDIRDACDSCKYLHETEEGVRECCLNPKPQPVEPERPACRHYEDSWL